MAPVPSTTSAWMFVRRDETRLVPKACKHTASGNLAALASQNNWSGIIVNGCIRDQLEIKEEKIGVKALNSNPKKSNKNDGGEFGVDLNFADTDISEGDYIYADEDGIIISKEDLQI